MPTKRKTITKRRVSPKQDIDERTLRLEQANKELKRQLAESKLIAEILGENNLRLHTLIQAIPDMVYFKDDQGRYLMANAAAEKFMGLMQGELDGKTDEELLPPDLVTYCKNSDKLVSEGHHPVPFEEHYTDVNGEKKSLETIKAPIFDNRGNFIGLVGVSRDVTERKKTEEMVRESNTALQRQLSFTNTLLKAIPMAVFYKDVEGRYLGCNEEFEKLFGVTADDIKGKTVFDLWPGDLAQDYHQHDMELLQDPAHQVYESSILDCRGERRDVFYHKDVFMNGDGSVGGIIGTFMDITDYKGIQSRLEKKTAEQNAILENALIGIAFLKDRQFVWINSRMEQMFGYKLQEVKGLTTDIFYTTSESYEQFGKEAYPILASGGTYHAERLMKKKDGSFFWCSLSGKAVDPFPLSRNSIWILQDIDDRKHIEEELKGYREYLEDLVKKRTEEAMRAMHLASIGELAAGVAHEINNPITSIINYAQILEEKPADVYLTKDIAARIMNDGNRIARIVAGLLSFGRESKNEKKSFKVKDIIHDTLTLSTAQLKKDNIRVTLDLAESVPEIMVNAQQLQQVFINLISNSRYALNLKYSETHEDKKIEIECDACTINNSPFVRTIFTDYGPGIPEEIMDKVKKPFFTTKPSGQGTGLGLSISSGIIEEHGGLFSVESKEGEFTKVIIDLPVI